jgi:NAD(P)-dependent dehydrogenase (short-subunit alcohol dehydrogenase family)
LALLSPLAPESAFQLVKRFGPILMRPDASGAAKFLISVTRMDGAFGFGGGPVEHPMDGALCGLVKTAAQEWAGVFCRAFDLKPDDIPPTEAAGLIVDEILFGADPAPLEIGLSTGGRKTLKSAPAAYETGSAEKLNGVWVVTGGARGVTAACTKALADESDLFFVLIGRSPAPDEEPEWLSGIVDPSEMKKAILKNAFKGQSPKPSELESDYKKHMAAREIMDTLTCLNRHGKGAVYLQTDVLNEDALSEAMNMIRSQYGQITGIIHGAGVLQDRLIIEKSVEQFHQVFDTKVLGLRHLLDATPSDSLTHVILFSSVAARSGNSGQVDYAMANEVLNKTAWRLKEERPDLRVLSINWGPWDGGMVTPALKRMFESKGVTPILLSEGAESFVRLVTTINSATPAEVMVGHGFENQPILIKADPSLSLSFKQDLNTERFPIFSPKNEGSVSSVPLSLIAEWCGLGAIHANPGLSLHGIDDLRLFERIPVAKEVKTIRLMSGKARKVKGLFEVDVEIRNGFRSGVEFVHSKAKAVLTDRPETPPVFDGDPLLKGVGKGKMLGEVYNRPPLSGSPLKGIQEVLGMDRNGAAAQIATAPTPDQWMTAPLRNHWIADPLAIEGAFQLLSLWAYEHKKGNYTITQAESYRQYGRRFPAHDLVALLKIRDTQETSIIADITLLGPERTVVAEIKGCVASAS